VSPGEADPPACVPAERVECAGAVFASAFFLAAADVDAVELVEAQDEDADAPPHGTNRRHRRKTIDHQPSQVRSDCQSVSSALSASVSVAAAGVAAVQDLARLESLARSPPAAAA